MSLTLRIGTETIDLREGAEIDLTMTCPIFDKDSVARVFSMPFRLPKSPGNVTKLRNLNRFDSAAPYVLDDVHLLLDEALYEKGELVCTGGDADDIEVVFRTKPISILADAGKVQINTILEKIIAGGTGVGGFWKYEMESFPSTYSISLGTEAIATYTPSAGTTLDIATFQFASAINNAVPGIVIGASSGVITLSAAMVNQFPVTQTVAFALVDYLSEGDDDQATMTDLIEGMVKDGDDRITWPMLRWLEAYGGKAPDFRTIVNPVSGSYLAQNPYYDHTDDWRYTVMPLVRWPYVMSKIAEAMDGLEYAGDVWENEDLQKLILVNNYSLDHVCADRYPDSSESSEDFRYLNGYVQEIDLNDHVPAMTAAAFWLAFTGTFCLWMETAKKTVIFRKKRDLVLQPPVDWSAYVGPDYGDTITEDKGYKLDYTRRKEDKFVPAIPGSLEPYVSGLGKELETIPTGTLYMNNVATDGTGGVVRIPHTQQRLESAFLGGKASQYPLQYLFYRGLQTSNVGISYPYATHDDKNRLGATIGQFSLDWQGTNGLHAQWWKGIAGLNNKREVKIPAVVPVGELFRLREWKNARLYFWHPNGAVVVVIKTINFKYRADNRSGFVPVQLTAAIT